MKRITAEDPESRSPDMVAANIREIARLFPDAVAEGKVDFESLRELLGDAVDDGDEKFGLIWHGKRHARRLALRSSTGTLRPCPEESVEWDSTKNLMIEGDNLEVLKLLERSYTNKVKLIYIDPPYNTGKDFVYRDNHRDGIRNYLKITGQLDDNGDKLCSNTDASGRFHTNWLNMMYPRLKVARNCLTSDGIILVSIGDEEAHHLRLMCDDIFGYDNFCGAFVWEKKKKPSFLDRNMGTVTDYIVAYAKDRIQSPAFTAGLVEEGKKYPFNNAGNSMTVLTFPEESVTFNMVDQIVAAQDMSKGNIKTELLDDVCILGGKNQGKFRLRGEWRYSQSKLDELISEGGKILIGKIPFRPNYVSQSDERKKTANLLSYRINAIPTNEDATQQARDIFGGDVVSYPKPEGLLKYLIRSVSGGDDIVLDFFAGSGTTASGMCQQNVEDCCSRRFILVQLPQPLDAVDKAHAEAVEFCDKIGRPHNLAELTKEYLRRSGRRTKRLSSSFEGDVGFRVFKLDSSNIRAWEPDQSDLKQSVIDYVDHIKPGRSEDDLFYELLLKLGYDLCTPTEERELAGKRVRKVADGSLIACLAESIESADVDAVALGIAAWRDEMDGGDDLAVVFRDSAFKDEVAQANMTEVLRQYDIKDVRSL